MSVHPESTQANHGVSQRWSCTTLGDGIQHIDDANALLAEEQEILKQLQELDSTNGVAGERADPSSAEIADMETLPADDAELQQKSLGTPAVKTDVEPAGTDGKIPPVTPRESVVPEAEATLEDGPKVPTDQVRHTTPSERKLPRGMTLRQFNLRRAAKARIERMCAPHSKRKDLAAPEYLRKEWETGDRNSLADLLQSVNFEKEEFCNQLLVIVKRKKTFQLTVDEGFYTEAELRELGWSENKIKGAKIKCTALGKTHCRQNAYDGELEYWVVLKETGKRLEESSFEREHAKRMKADGDPTSALGDSFDGLDAHEKRNQQEKDKKIEVPNDGKYFQTKDSLKKFMASVMSKCGKLRSLVRDLKKSYASSSTGQCITDLEEAIGKMDAQYDLANDAWAKGEVDNYSTESWYSLAEKCIKDGTFVCSKAAALELKIRNAKKYYDKKQKDAEPPKNPKGPKTKKHHGK